MIEATHTAQPSLLAGKVKGYGPLRYRYCLDLAVTLAGKVAHFDASVIGAAGASAEKGSSLRVARDDRRDAIRMLKNFTGSDDAAKARLKKVRGKNERPDERATSLQGISRELKAVTEGIPAELVADAGVTHDLSKRLNGYAHAVVSTHDTAHEERAALAAQSDSMNGLDGRILHELRALAGAMTDTRKSDKSLPVLKIAALRNATGSSERLGDHATTLTHPDAVRGNLESRLGATGLRGLAVFGHGDDHARPPRGYPRRDRARGAYPGRQRCSGDLARRRRRSDLIEAQASLRSVVGLRGFARQLGREMVVLIADG